MANLMTLAEANHIRVDLVNAILEEIHTDARVSDDHEQFAQDYADWLIDSGWVTKAPGA